MFIDRSFTQTLPDGTSKDIQVTIGCPVQSGQDFSAMLTILGLSELVQKECYGVDSMQAVMSALAGCNSFLQSVDGLSWNGNSYNHLPVVAHLFDPGRRRRLRELLEEDEYALAQLALERDEIQRIKQAGLDA